VTVPPASPGPPAPSVAGAVLAGGRSRRMGRDKRWLEVDATPLLDRAVASVAAVAAEVRLVTSSPEDAAVLTRRTGLPADVDGWPGAGPLAALEAALAVARHEVVLVLAGDHPDAAPEVLRLLTDRLARAPDADAALLVSSDGVQPLVGAYRRTARPRLEALLEAGERRALAVLEACTVVTVPPPVWEPHDPAGATALDLDTPADLAARTDARGGGARGGDARGGDARGGDARPAPDATTSASPPPDRSDAEVVEDRRATRVEVVTVDAGRSHRADPASVTRRDDVVVAEEPLEIRACGPDQAPLTLVTTLRTPGHDAELAVGWLHAEGRCRSGDVVRVSVGDALSLARPDDQVTVHLRVPIDPDAVAARHTMATASCGVCGRATIDELAARCPPVPHHRPTGGVAWSTLAALPDRLRAHQRVFDATGGLHATGLFTADGELVTRREDVGRHNALDAAIGAHVLAGERPDDLVAVLSGRIGFELVAKVATAGIGVVAGVGAATDLAVRTAERLGVTVVAFLRGGRGNVLTHPERLHLDA
jgi:FdhD protein